ncbi:sterol desaturase family protein [Spirillospora sp. NPDC048911]|uniref:sterol desaturase family protein n=1 Tax=Spirillospora sp. NPDC048911 TaxID=3364527 RepID=UPI003713833B
MSRTQEFRRNGLTLTKAARLFLSYPNAKTLLPLTAATIATRLALGKFTKRDATTLAVTLAIEPFVEWLIHVNVLHLGPRTFRGKPYELPSSKKHRLHHRDPRNPDILFIPALPPTLFALVTANWAVLRKPRPTLTGIATSLTLMTAYEWTHFLIHSAYTPKSALYKKLRRTHQLHHFRNENYWYGIITPISDKVLGTYPAKEEVPPSPTVKTLGIS